MADQNNTPSWKTKTYILGTFLGAMMGLLSAYMFAREAEREGDDEEGPEIAPTTLLGLALSALALIREVAESARKGKKK